MLRIESPLSEKLLWTTATLESSSFTDTEPPHSTASAIASSVSALPRVSSKSSDEEKEKFLARVRMASRDLPLSRHRRTTDLKLNDPVRTLTDEEVEKLNLRYYNTDVHRAAFSVPQFVKTALEL